MPIPGRWLLVVTGELPRHAGNNRVEWGVFSVSAILIITKLYSELWSFPRLLKIILMIDSSPNINFIILSENNGELCIFYALLVKIWYWMEMITPILYFIVAPQIRGSWTVWYKTWDAGIIIPYTFPRVGAYYEWDNKCWCLPLGIPALTNELFRGFRSSTKEL